MSSNLIFRSSKVKPAMAPGLMRRQGWLFDNILVNMDREMTDNQLKVLKKIGQRYNYGRGKAHVAKVTELSLSLFDILTQLQLVAAPQSHKLLLEAAGYLHDIGISPEAKQKVMTWVNGIDIESCSNQHNLVSFKILSTEIPELLASQGLSPLPPEELSIILYCTLWHCSDRFEAVEGEPLESNSRTILFCLAPASKSSLPLRHHQFWHKMRAQRFCG